MSVFIAFITALCALFYFAAAALLLAFLIIFLVFIVVGLYWSYKEDRYL